MLLIGVVVIAYGINMVISGAFQTYTKGQGQQFFTSMVEQGTNILIYGIGGIFAIFIRNMFDGNITYFLMIAAMIIYGILLLVDLIRVVMTFFTTIALSFSKDYEGLCGNGKFADWLFFLSMILEAGIMGFLIFNMFKSIQ